jgi:hypothetical protein
MPFFLRPHLSLHQRTAAYLAAVLAVFVLAVQSLSLLHRAVSSPAESHHSLLHDAGFGAFEANLHSKNAYNQTPEFACQWLDHLLSAYGPCAILAKPPTKQIIAKPNALWQCIVFKNNKPHAVRVRGPPLYCTECTV